MNRIVKINVILHPLLYCIILVFYTELIDRMRVNVYWTKAYGNKIRHKIFYEDFLVILEEREEYFLLITGYFVEETYYKKGLLKEYNKCT